MQINEEAPRVVVLTVPNSDDLLSQVFRHLNQKSPLTTPEKADSGIRQPFISGVSLSNNLKRFSLALANYETNYQRFPDPASLKTPDGRPSGLSWRVHLLRDLEYVALWKEFKLDEPWDSPHNLKLLDRMPPEFHTNGARPGETAVKMFVGPGTALVPGMTYETMKDGAANTILAVHGGADTAVPWTKPDDYPLNPDDPVSVLGNFGEFLVVVSFAGKTRAIPRAELSQTLLPMITPLIRRD